MKRGKGTIRGRMLRGGAILLGVILLGALLGAIFGDGHNPNHDINLEQARAAANRVHTPLKPGVTKMPGAGG